MPTSKYRTILAKILLAAGKIYCRIVVVSCLSLCNLFSLLGWEKREVMYEDRQLHQLPTDRPETLDYSSSICYKYTYVHTTVSKMQQQQQWGSKEDLYTYVQLPLAFLVSSLLTNLARLYKTCCMDIHSFNTRT